MSAEQTWQQLLDADRATWLESIPAFREGLMAAGVRFGERPLCNHLRPKFLTEVQAADLAAVAEATLAGIMQAKDRLLQDPELMAMLRLTDLEREMVQVDPGYGHIAPCVRLDSFITASGPQFVELNGECPAGPAYSDHLAAGFLRHPLMQRFAKQVPTRYVAALPPLLETLLSCYREWGGRDRPVIGIIDYDFVPTWPEFELCRDFFEQHGYPTVVADPRALTFDGEDLVADGRRIDLVYKRVLINEFIERLDEVSALYDAYRAGKVCMVNPFRSKLVHKKAIFAVLTSDGRDEWLKPEQRDLIDRAVPWTRNVAEGRTTVDGRDVDLIPWVVANRADLVLKPNDDYGGKGIFLGWECDERAWSSALETALGADYVVQKRLHLLPESFPSMDDGLAGQDLFVDLDPYMYLGRMHGALARLGAGGLCNVTSGGGQVPMMIVKDGEPGKGAD